MARKPLQGSADAAPCKFAPTPSASPLKGSGADALVKTTKKMHFCLQVTKKGIYLHRVNFKVQTGGSL